MIAFIEGDLFADKAEALVNPVNCVGVMGVGLALYFKRRYPDYFLSYASACKTYQLIVGEVHFFDRGESVTPRYLISFPTKRHWKDESILEDIHYGLGSLVDTIQSLDIRSIAIPALGCGLGGLGWEKVKLLMQEVLGSLVDVDIRIYVPRQ